MQQKNYDVIDSKMHTYIIDVKEEGIVDIGRWLGVRYPVQLIYTKRNKNRQFSCHVNIIVNFVSNRLG